MQFYLFFWCGCWFIVLGDGKTLVHIRRVGFCKQCTFMEAPWKLRGTVPKIMSLTVTKFISSVGLVYWNLSAINKKQFDKRVEVANLIAISISNFCKYRISLFCFTPQQWGKFAGRLLRLQCNFLHRARVKENFPAAWLALPEEQYPDLLRAESERHPAKIKKMHQLRKNLGRMHSKPFK